MPRTVTTVGRRARRELALRSPRVNEKRIVEVVGQYVALDAREQRRIGIVLDRLS